MDLNPRNTPAKTLRAMPTRRATLSAIFALATTLPFARETVARKHTGHKQCKPKCPACKTCKKGKCKPKAATDQCRPARCGTGGACLVFVTTTRYGANLGGLSGADAFCQAEAEAATLPGVYQAWLADDTGGPSTRFLQSTSPYQLVTGEIVASNWADLTDGVLRHAIDTDAAGAVLSGTESAWTNATPYGARSGANDCLNWTSNSASAAGDGVVGRIDLIDATWTEYTAFACNFALRLYCFQQY